MSRICSYYYNILIFNHVTIHNIKKVKLKHVKFDINNVFYARRKLYTKPIYSLDLTKCINLSEVAKVQEAPEIMK